MSDENLHQIVELQMIHCEECGKPFDTFRHLLYSVKELPPWQRGMLLPCPECRAKKVSELLISARGGGGYV